MNASFRKLIIFILFLCFLSVFYFSWLPSPNLEQETYLPSWLRNWSNYYYNLRTAVPFVAIGFLLELGRQKNNLIGRNRSIQKLFIQNTAISSAVVCIAEGGQFLIQYRCPDLMDIFFGILGSGIGSLGYYFIRYLINTKNRVNAE